MFRDNNLLVAKLFKKNLYGLSRVSRRESESNNGIIGCVFKERS